MNILFSLRKDRNNFRPIFLLGNEMGYCHYACKFCINKKSPKLSSDENIKLFDKKLYEYKQIINGPYHPVIYNEGNCTDPNMFSRKTLEHVLKAFNGDPDVLFVSINSRENETTPKVLKYLANMELSFPIHFIDGVESFTPQMPRILGKNTVGSMDLMNSKIKPFNSPSTRKQPKRGYTFGLDINLIFLPELYLDNGEPRSGNDRKIKKGLKRDLEQLLIRIDPKVPVEINFHPYTRVKDLDYDDADLDWFMGVLPELENMVTHYNNKFPDRATHIFVGVQGSGYDSLKYKKQIQYWEPAINEFNQSGNLPPMTNG